MDSLLLQSLWLQRLCRFRSIWVEVKTVPKTILKPGYVKIQDKVTSGVAYNTAKGVQVTGQRESKFVLKVEDKSKIGIVGGKAFNISKMTREGITVPPGFCITTDTYNYFMNFNNISEEDEKISDKIKKGLMPPNLAEIILDTYKRYLNGKLCAVRSSSPSEDLKSASFAGQYKSVLNVKGENLLDAVKECWASLWSKSAVEYRKKMGISEKAAMAVLIQEMVPAEASGVLFTEDNMIIEAVWGLGNMLVGGKVIADRFVVERKKFTVLERTISHKQVMSQVTPDGGVEEIHVPEHLQDQPVLDDDHIQKLCALGKKVEELFGCHQDIEWALHNNDIILLQARPVTVKTPTVWSRANIAETQPNYVTYLSRIPENRPDFFVLGVVPLLERFGIKELPEDIKFLEYIYGYIYANITNLHNIIGSIPGLPPAVIDQSIGYVPEGKTPESKLELSTILKMLPGISRVIYFFSNLPKEAEKVIPRSSKLTSDIRHRNLKELTLEELDDLVWKMYDTNQEVFQVHASTMLANMLLFGIFQKLLRKLGEEDTGNVLITGLEGMSSFQLGVKMWTLAESASKSPRVSGLILSRRDGILEELNQFQEGHAFLKELDNFMEECGDRCSQEMELSVPRWEENPSFVLSVVKTYLSVRPPNPVETMETQKKARLEATDRILTMLSRSPVKKLIFRKILEKTQKYLLVRENLKTAWVRSISAMRVLYLAIAEKLVDGGILESTDDIFYLKMTEVSDTIAGNLKKGQLDFIEERRKEKLECEHLDVPMVIVGKPLPVEELRYTVEPKEVLEGTGCSHGTVTGKARVILDPLKCSEVAEGDILVAPVTDPGWSPLFVTAGGLVMELGGTLSHGVIIAREYGIPAVVGVENATKIIKTGQVITVDGTKGLVYISNTDNVK